MTLRGRLVALAVIVALLLAATVVVLLTSRTAGCSVVAPRPALPAVLRALGDFDQAYDVSDVAGLEDAAARAAGALHADLIGSTPETPVTVAAGLAGSPDAVVVPLRSPTPSTGGPPRLAGLVVFLRDCQGGAYFSTVEDDGSLQPALYQFPALSGAQAQSRLGTAAVRLDYLLSPLSPQWVTVAAPVQSLSAR